MIHFFHTPFTGVGLYDGFRGRAWLKRRIDIFKRFTLAALLNQTKKEFIIWCAWRPQEEKEPLVAELLRTMRSVRGIETVFTYRGPCLYDDKYDQETAKTRLARSLSMSLPTLTPYIGREKFVALTCQPSDDMYASDAARMIQAVKPSPGLAAGWTRGYIMDLGTKRVREYDPDTLPPFATVYFPARTFMDAERHVRYIGPYASHEYVKDHLRFKELPGRGFCVGTHGNNISTTFSHPYAGREIEGAERESVWLDFGVYDADPYPTRAGFGLAARRIVNVFPKPLHDIVKRCYHRYRAYVQR